MTSASAFKDENYTAIFSSDITPNLSLQNLYEGASSSSAAIVGGGNSNGQETGPAGIPRRKSSVDTTHRIPSSTQPSRRASSVSSTYTSNSMDSYDVISSAIISLSSRDDELFSPYATTEKKRDELFDDVEGVGKFNGGPGGAAPNYIALEEENISVPALLALLILPHAWMLF